jgi:hypothetical protein
MFERVFARLVSWRLSVMLTLWGMRSVQSLMRNTRAMIVKKLARIRGNVNSKDLTLKIRSCL